MNSFIKTLESLGIEYAVYSVKEYTGLVPGSTHGVKVRFQVFSFCGETFLGITTDLG